MKKPLLISSFLISFQLHVISQETAPQPTTSYKKFYTASASELIFSAADFGKVSITTPGPADIPVTSPSFTPDIVPRFSAFLHIANQMHFNVSNTFGFYSGFGLRNIGMINKFNDSLRIKQRFYSLGVPLAFKIGDMGKKIYFSAGAEAEFFFHYKQKTFAGNEGRIGEKVQKFNEWFSKRNNLFMPSVFVEFNFGKGNYVRLKYYLSNILINGKQDFIANGVTSSFTVERSQLFSFSLGKVVGKKRK
jgi:hypothetical protein